MTKGLFALIALSGHIRPMYAIDVHHLVRRGTLGSRVDDPTLPDRSPRLAALRKLLGRTGKRPCPAGPVGARPEPAPTEGRAVSA